MNDTKNFNIQIRITNWCNSCANNSCAMLEKTLGKHFMDKFPNANQNLK
jgi:hypothetical protein